MTDYAVIPRAETVLAEPTRSDQRFAMSYEQFLVWADERHAEWVDGEVIVFMPPVTRHQVIAGFLSALLLRYITLFHLGKLLIAPFEVRLIPGRSSREPDLLFVANENLHRLTPERYEGTPDLLIEIISPNSVTRDRKEKFAEYERVGVREYWLVDARDGKERLDIYTQNKQGRYNAAMPDEDGRYHSTVLPGFWLLPEWLWQPEPPDIDDIMLEVVGEPYVQHIAERVRDAGEEASVNLITHLLDAGDESTRARLVAALRQQGYLPPEGSEL